MRLASLALLKPQIAELRGVKLTPVYKASLKP